jgi:MFS family permease
VRYQVLAWLGAAALIAYLPRTCIAVAESTIRADLPLPDRALFGLVLHPTDQMSLAMSAFFLTYALCMLPAGWLADVWGTRRALTLFALLWSACAGLTAVVDDFPGLLATRLGLGAAQAGIFACTTCSLARWFPPTQRALTSGVLGSAMSVGTALAAALTGLLLEAGVGWRWVFALYALPGFVWALGFFGWFRDSPRDHRAVNAAELELLGASSPPRGRHEPTPWGRLFASPAMWWISAQQFFRAAGYMFYTSWFATYLQEARHVSIGGSGLLTSLPVLGVVVGSVAGGLVSDWVLVATGSRRLSRQGVSIVSQLGCALLVLLAYLIDDVWLAVLVISVGSFTAAFAASCAYAITIDMGGKHVAIVFSLMNMAGNLGAMVFPLVIPPLVRLTGDRWDVVLFLFAGIYLAAAACWALINPTGTVFDRSSPDPLRT